MGGVFLVLDEAPDVQQLLVDFKILWRDWLLTLQPALVQVTLLLGRSCRFVLNDLFKLFEELQLLNKSICPIVGFTQQWSYLCIQYLSCGINFFHCSTVVFKLDGVDGAVEMLLIIVEFGVEVSRICLQIGPIAEVPRCICGIRGGFFDDFLDLGFLFWIRLIEVLLPHLLNKFRQSIPRHQVSVAV